MRLRGTLLVALLASLLIPTVYAGDLPKTAIPLALQDGQLDPDGKTVWYDAQALGIEGKGWKDTESTYDRLPQKAKGGVPQRVWNYGRFPAGLSVRFATDAETVRVRWTLSDEKHNFAHLSDIATSGIDLYYRNEQSGKFRYTHADFRTFTPKKLVNTTSFDLPRSEEYELNLPTYRILDRLEIGIPQGKTLAKECNYLTRVSEVGEIIEQVDHPNVRVLADLYHSTVMGESPEDYAKYAHLMAVIEIAEKRARTVPGVDGQDFRPYFQALKRKGYRGPIEIEGKWTPEQLPKAFATIREQSS